MRPFLLSGLSVLALSVVAVPAMAQEPNPEVERLEEQLGILQAQIGAMEGQMSTLQSMAGDIAGEISRLRSAVADADADAQQEPQAQPTRPSDSINGELFDLNQSFTPTHEQLASDYHPEDAQISEWVRNPDSMRAIAGVRPDGQGQIERGYRLLRDTTFASPIPGRPLQPGGLRPTIELGKGSKATLGLSVPFQVRLDDNSITKVRSTNADGLNTSIDTAAGYRPAVWIPSFEISAPLEDGEGTLLSINPNDDDDTFDFADNLSLKLGLDFLAFRGIHYYETEREMDNLLDKAVDTCREEARLKALREAKTPDVSACNRGTIQSWVLQTKVANGTSSGFEFARPELATRFLAMPYNAPKNAIPTWGFGASVSYTSRDFSFRSLPDPSDLFVIGPSDPTDPDSDEKLLPNFAAMLPGANIDENEDILEIEAHGLLYWNLTSPKYQDNTGPAKMPGIMFVPQVTYRSSFDYYPNNQFSTCDFELSVSPFPKDCDDIRLGAPVNQETVTLSLEARSQLINVPYINRLGFAPKLSYGLDDNGWTFDLPLYFETKNEFSSGLRLRYEGGHEDIFNNSLDRAWSLSIFFSPLTFFGYD